MARSISPLAQTGQEKANWIKTFSGRGFFPKFRFCGPAEAFFDKTWQLEDVIAVK
jgi:hypothetical protein